MSKKVCTLTLNTILLKNTHNQKLKLFDNRNLVFSNSVCYKKKESIMFPLRETKSTNDDSTVHMALLLQGL